MTLALVNNNVDRRVQQKDARHAETQNKADLFCAHESVLHGIRARIIVEILGFQFFALQVATTQNGVLRGLGSAGKGDHQRDGRNYILNLSHLSFIYNKYIGLSGCQKATQTPTLPF